MKITDMAVVLHCRTLKRRKSVPEEFREVFEPLKTAIEANQPPALRGDLE
jgi:hypothetical protein